jgi:hypothetical protein
MKAYVVTEGDLDRELLQFLLPTEISEDVAIVTAGGASGATSMARSLIALRRVPVALVVDANSISPDFVRERSLGLRELLQSVTVGTPAEVFLAVPEMEEIFFQVPHLLGRVLKVDIPETLAIMAEARPKDALSQLFDSHKSIKSMPQLLNALTSSDLEELRLANPISDLTKFLLHALSEVSAAATRV